MIRNQRHAMFTVAYKYLALFHTVSYSLLWLRNQVGQHDAFEATIMGSPKLFAFPVTSSGLTCNSRCLPPPDTQVLT